MDKAKDLDIDLRHTNDWTSLYTAMRDVGGLPIIILPLDEDHKPIQEGFACSTREEYTVALRQAYRATPCHIVRLVPVMRVIEDTP